MRELSEGCCLNDKDFSDNFVPKLYSISKSSTNPL